MILRMIFVEAAPDPRRIATHSVNSQPMMRRHFRGRKPCTGAIWSLFRRNPRNRETAHNFCALSPSPGRQSSPLREALARRTPRELLDELLLPFDDPDDDGALRTAGAGLLLTGGAR